MKAHEIFYRNQWIESQIELICEINRQLSHIKPKPKEGDFVKISSGEFRYKNGKWERYYIEDAINDLIELVNKS